MNLRITWPIEDQEQTLEAIKAEARESLMITLIINGLCATGKPTWQFQNGDRPALIAEVGVVERGADEVAA